MVLSITIDSILPAHKAGARTNLAFIGWVYYLFCSTVYNLLCSSKIECRSEMILVLTCFCLIKHDKN